MLAAAAVPVLLLALSHAAGAQVGGFQPEIRRTPEGVRFVSTGVGFDSRVNLPRFSVQFVFAVRTGAYLADIDAEIVRVPSGKPVRIHSPGPWLLVDLPPGHYRVTARTSKGHEAARAFEAVPKRVTTVRVAWNISDKDI